MFFHRDKVHAKISVFPVNCPCFFQLPAIKVYTPGYQLPFMGSIFSGAVMAFLSVTLLLSIYLCLSSTPEGHGGAMLLMDPRGLTVANGIVSFGSTQGVGQIFALCSQDVAGGCALFMLFALLACWVGDVPFALLDLSERLRAGRLQGGSGQAQLPKTQGGVPSVTAAREGLVYNVAVVSRFVLHACMAFVPPAGVLIKHGRAALPWTVAAFSLCIAGASLIGSFLDAAYFLRGGQRGRLGSDLDRGSAILLGISPAQGDAGVPTGNSQSSNPSQDASGGKGLWDLSSANSGGGTTAVGDHSSVEQVDSSGALQKAGQVSVVEPASPFFWTVSRAGGRDEHRSMHHSRGYSGPWLDAGGNVDGRGMGRSMGGISSSSRVVDGGRDARGSGRGMTGGSRPFVQLHGRPPWTPSSSMFAMHAGDIAHSNSSRERRRSSTPVLGVPAHSPVPDFLGTLSSVKKWHDA
jgi:hypothetical protein